MLGSKRGIKEMRAEACVVYLVNFTYDMKLPTPKFQKLMILEHTKTVVKLRCKSCSLSLPVAVSSF